MTRISATQVVQRVDDDLVVLDESTGEEVLVRADRVPKLLMAVCGLYNMKLVVPE